MKSPASPSFTLSAAFLSLLFLFKSLLWIMALPPGQSHDEMDHFDYVVYLVEKNQFPIIHENGTRQHAMIFWGGFSRGEYESRADGSVVNPLFEHSVEAYKVDGYVFNFEKRQIEAGQPPLYYLSVALATLPVRLIPDPLWHFFSARWVSALFGLLLMLAALKFGFETFPNSTFRYLPALFALLHPNLTIYTIAVTNDSLLILLSFLLYKTAVESKRERSAGLWKLSLLMGLLLATKANSLAFLPWLLLWFHKEYIAAGWRKLFAHMALISAPVLSYLLIVQITRGDNAYLSFATRVYENKGPAEFSLFLSTFFESISIRLLSQLHFLVGWEFLVYSIPVIILLSLLFFTPVFLIIKNKQAVHSPEVYLGLSMAVAMWLLLSAGSFMNLWKLGISTVLGRMMLPVLLPFFIAICCLIKCPMQKKSDERSRQLVAGIASFLLILHGHTLFAVMPEHFQHVYGNLIEGPKLARLSPLWAINLPTGLNFPIVARTLVLIGVMIYGAGAFFSGWKLFEGRGRVFQIGAGVLLVMVALLLI